MNRSCYGINKVLDVKLLVSQNYKKYANRLTNSMFLYHTNNKTEGFKQCWEPSSMSDASGILSSTRPG